ncbi:MAG: hypothetical protein M9926_06845 [Lentimicrobium sp.]|nr:hypothetical protein [Lentimicrobium sp.]MCO5256462.1 hypothetical protein [Lentimicrobium sp.]
MGLIRHFRQPAGVRHFVAHLPTAVTVEQTIDEQFNSLLPDSLNVP